MKPLYIKLIFAGIIILFCCNCSNGTFSKEESVLNQLPDSLFPFKDIQNSLLVDKFWFDKNGKLYTDSVSGIPLIRLDSSQKLKWIVPVLLSSEGEVYTDSNYVLQYMSSYFVSKQRKIGEWTPIIIGVYGDDYESLFYILLDKGAKVVSFFKLNGGLVGPSEGPDETLQLPPVRHSYLKNDEISTYTLTEFIKPDSIQQPSLFDSVSYRSKILPSGKIETKRLDSVHFKRMSDWW